MSTATTRTHTAWRFNVTDAAPRYVQTIRAPGGHGDRYSYTDDASKALQMTERQCQDFCAYMRDCDSVGYWS